VRRVEPVKLRNYYRTVALGGIVAVFFLLYIYQHFRCIDLSFQLEEVKVEQVKAGTLNSSLKLEIASLRNPMRIDVIARRQLGLTEPLPTQVQEYDAPSGAEVAAARYVHQNRAR
jgi:cell division protein FtsL